MKWLTTNWTTIAMAIILSLVTVGLLTGPSEVDTFKLTAELRPDVRAEVGSLEYIVDGAPVTEYFTVNVTANRNDITPGLRLICQPILDQSKFPSDVTVRETQVEITPQDFNLTPDMQRRIRIANFPLKIRFAPMTTKELPIQVSTQDILDSHASRYLAERVWAEPSIIKVRLPFDKAQTLTSLPVRPIRIAGRTESFRVEGMINTDLADYRDVRRQENFSIRVELKLIEAKDAVEGLPLFLSCPVIHGYKAELVDRGATFKVEISGAADMVRALKERPDLITVYARVERAFWNEGIHQVPVKCDVQEEFRKEITVKLAPGEDLFAAVKVTRN